MEPGAGWHRVIRGGRTAGAATALLLAAAATAGPPAPPAAEDPGFGPSRSPRRAGGPQAIPLPDPTELEGFAGKIVLRPLRNPEPAPVAAAGSALGLGDLAPGRSEERAARARARAERAQGPERDLLLRLARHHETGKGAPEVEQLAAGVLVVRFPATGDGAEAEEVFTVDPAAPAGLRVYRLDGPAGRRSGTTDPAVPHGPPAQGVEPPGTGSRRVAPDP